MKIKKTMRSTSEISMASTSDIAFLLIIFFMVTSSFTLKEGLHLTLPSNKKKPQIVMNNEVATIKVMTDGKTLLNDKRMSTEEIEESLKKILEKDKETIVLLKIQKDVPYQNAVDIIDVIKVVGAQKLSMRMMD